MSSHHRHVIELFYDIVSPYSLIAYTILASYKDIWNIDIQLRPVFLGGIMQGASNKPPGTNPAKAIYSTKDLPRLMSQIGKPHKRFEGDALAVMSNSLKSMRLCTAVGNLYPDKLAAFSFGLSARFWCDGVPDIIEPTGWKAVAQQAGLTEQQLNECIKLSETPEIKKQLIDVTGLVVKVHGFGAPTFFVHVDKASETSQPHPAHPDQQMEMVFGSDRIETVAYLINKPYSGMRPKQQSKL